MNKLTPKGKEFSKLQQEIKRLNQMLEKINALQFSIEKDRNEMYNVCASNKYGYYKFSTWHGCANKNKVVREFQTIFPVNVYDPETTKIFYSRWPKEKKS